ncbi:MAG: lipoyl synthase [Candidatus Omnitrophota bacterium]
MKNRLPAWFKQEIPSDKALETKDILSEFNVSTVCRKARCPNSGRCFKDLKISFMILGDICTRNCRFCAVDKSESGVLEIDHDEPRRIAQAARKLGLKYVVITSVTRDDLPDAGAAQFAETIREIREIGKNIKLEVLIPDFNGNIPSLKTVISAKPNVIAHNIETVRRLYGEIRPKSSYETSLDVLRIIKKTDTSLTVKSSIILGLGEQEEDLLSTMRDLKSTGLDILTLGQYLSPGPDYYPVKEFIAIERFKRYRDMAMRMGFKTVLSGPLVRSSYEAEETYKEFIYV